MAAQEYTVTGPNAVNGVPTGGTIKLDPDDSTPGAINVAALLEGGVIEAKSKAPAKAPAKKSDGGDE